MKCNFINRVSVHKSVTVGGASLGQCKNETAPGLTCCWDHAVRETLVMYIKMLLKEKEQLLIDKVDYHV